MEKNRGEYHPCGQINFTYFLKFSKKRFYNKGENEGVNEPHLSKISESFSAKKRSLTINVEISLLLTTLKNKKYA